MEKVSNYKLGINDRHFYYKSEKSRNKGNYG